MLAKPFIFPIRLYFEAYKLSSCHHQMDMSFFLFLIKNRIRSQEGARENIPRSLLWECFFLFFLLGSVPVLHKQRRKWGQISQALVRNDSNSHIHPKLSFPSVLHGVSITLQLILSIMIQRRFVLLGAETLSFNCWHHTGKGREALLAPMMVMQQVKTIYYCHNSSLLLYLYQCEELGKAEILLSDQTIDVSSDAMFF